MRSIKQMIPVSIKAPIEVLIREQNQVPYRLIFQHMRYSYFQNSNRSDAEKQRAASNIQKHNYAYLCRRYQDKALEFFKECTSETPPEKPTIWIFWWQGEEQAPEVIRCCTASIRVNAGSHPVIVIDQSNFEQYADVSECMLEKLRTGSISLTHFSDYYRMALLEQNGGLWIDASVFAAHCIREELFQKPLFTIRNPGMDPSNISDWNWMVGVIGGWKGNPLFHTAAKLLELYWQDHQCLIDYFVFDYLVRIIYDHIPQIREQISDVPPNNPNFYLFQQAVNHPGSCYEVLKEKAGDTNLFKISWKGNYKRLTADGEETVFSRWLKENQPEC